MANRVVGVDVGGTFTDLIALDPETGALNLAKVPTTPANQAEGVLDAIDTGGVDLATLDLIIHGTTTTTNAVLERKMAPTGMITTRGFRDVLELGRRTRPQAYGLTGTFAPIIPRNLRLEVPERMDAQGVVVIALDTEAVLDAGRALIEAGCTSVVVHFLHAYANPSHEQQAAEALTAVFPADRITMGHKVLSETREFERGVTAAVNASVKPILSNYINRLTDTLEARKYGGDILVMTGNGGTVPATEVAEDAAKTVMSGPASGVTAAAVIGRMADMPDLITYDMGGTSTDVALIQGAEPAVSSETEIEYALPIHVPMVDVRTVGAGGGSIAWIDGGGLLRIGPESAGADPGPICYGRGGTRVTLSDANLLLGRLDPSKLAVSGGVSVDDVAQAMDAQIATPLGLSVQEAARAVIHVANVTMAGAIRMVSVSLGVDPRDYALFAFGGAGPLHAVALARELGIPRVLIPARPGLTNAIGCLTADFRQDLVQTINCPIDALDSRTLPDLFAAQAETGRGRIGARAERIEVMHSLDMQFIGQTHLLRVPVADANATPDDIQKAFEQAYFDRFRVTLDTIRAMVVNVSTTVVGRRAPPALSALIDPGGRKSVDAALTGSRTVTFADAALDTPVYWRDHLPLDPVIEGPAIIEQVDTTTLLPRDCTARGDTLGNLIVEVSV